MHTNLSNEGHSFPIKASLTITKANGCLNIHINMVTGKSGVGYKQFLSIGDPLKLAMVADLVKSMLTGKEQSNNKMS